MLQLILLFALLTAKPLWADSIGFLVVATGKYIEFVPPLIESARQHFLKEHKVTYYVFTDSVMYMSTCDRCSPAEREGRDVLPIGEDNSTRPLAEPIGETDCHSQPAGEQRARVNMYSVMAPVEDIVWVAHNRLGWPYDTMMRFHVYYQHRDLFEKEDYLFACDADMRFVGDVESNVLGKRVATQHPGFVGHRGTYETRPLSKACILDHEGEHYFAGGFYGGSTQEFLKLCKVNAEHIDEDLTQGIIAVWHDESHINRYFIDHKPTKILTPSYCYPESWNLPYEKRLLALDKNHSEYRK